METHYVHTRKNADAEYIRLMPLGIFWWAEKWMLGSPSLDTGPHASHTAGCTHNRTHTWKCYNTASYLPFMQESSVFFLTRSTPLSMDQVIYKYYQSVKCQPTITLGYSPLVSWFHSLGAERNLLPLSKNEPWISWSDNNSLYFYATTLMYFRQRFYDSLCLQLLPSAIISKSTYFINVCKRYLWIHKFVHKLNMSFNCTV